MNSWIDLINTGYIVFKPNNWKVSKDAPKEVVELFNKLIKRDKEQEAKGIIVD